jgi:hypothetical protein
LNVIIVALAACLPCQAPDLTELMKQLKSDDFVEQGRAAKTLEAMGPAIVARLRSLAEAPDGAPDVQAWCRRIADRIESNGRRFQKLIERLGSLDDEEKDAAERELLRAGPVAIPFLRQAMDTDNKNLRFRAERLAVALSSECNLAALLWTRLESGGWLPVPFQSLSIRKTMLTKESRLAIDDDKVGSDTGNHVEISALPMPWEEISGLEIRVRPVTAAHSYLILGAGGPPSWHVLGIQSKEPLGFYAFQPAGEAKAVADPGALLGRTPDYALRIENMGKRWRFRVGDLEVKSVDGLAPSTMRLVVNDGRTEFFDLKVRKK